MRKVGAVFHEAALRHDPGARHPEHAARLEAILHHLDVSGIAARLEWIAPEPAPRELVQLVHDPELVRVVEDVEASGGGWLDYPNTRVSRGTLEAALRGSQGAVDATARVLSGEWDAAMVLMRPPGHHATRSEPMGFCITNHAAVATRWALAEGGVSRVFVLDWDVHHGNGTEDIFWQAPDVLYASMHEYPAYPGTGWVTDTGAAAGAGLTINVPLPAGTGEDVYSAVIDEIVLPAARDFRPELVVVSAGFDAHARDPLANMRLLGGAYHRFAQRLDGLAAGPVCILEGGYDLGALAQSVAATLSALLGDESPSGVDDSELGTLPSGPESVDWARLAAEVHTRERPAET